MNKKMLLINASHEEESRVALVEDERLLELDIEASSKAQTKSNIYKGMITKIEPSLQAAFVEYGSERQGFLPIGEIHPSYWKDDADKSADPRKINIQDVLEAKQTILVQIVKEERGSKGAAITTFISLAGRYLVLSPNTQRGGISRKLNEEDRRALKRIISNLEVPEEMGLIVRTAGKDRNLEFLESDFEYLKNLWDEIVITADTAPMPSLIYQDGDLSTRAIRDHFTDDIDEVWVDNQDVYHRTRTFMHAVLPGKERLVRLFQGKTSLFRHFRIEEQAATIHERELRLPSGASVVFDPTEALTSIDINSSRATTGTHIDDTALTINLEATHEIARQLRVRDIGGLVVIDYIDMASRKHGQEVEEALRDACKNDKARIQITRISRFGLLEMSRQRLHPSVREVTTQVCPQCSGHGRTRTLESLALHLLSRMEHWGESCKHDLHVLEVQMPSEAGEYLINNKREHLARVEQLAGVHINLHLRSDFTVPHYRIERQVSERGQQKVDVLEDTNKQFKLATRGNRRVRAPKAMLSIVAAQKAQKEQEGKCNPAKSSAVNKASKNNADIKSPSLLTRIMCKLGLLPAPKQESTQHSKKAITNDERQAKNINKQRRSGSHNNRPRRQQKRTQTQKRSAEEVVDTRETVTTEVAADSSANTPTNAQDSGERTTKPRRRRRRGGRGRSSGQRQEQENSSQSGSDNEGNNQAITATAKQETPTASPPTLPPTPPAAQ
ncbi:MAG: Rne/Rng family ribonuclease [Mariprofundales bacterium]